MSSELDRDGGASGAIAVSQVTKSYRTYEKPRDRLYELLSGGRRTYHRNVTALDDVSFALKAGGRLGIVGENGSGKSTLLKILAGVLSPSAGKVHVNGRVSALLELGAGFSADLSGRENIAQFCLLHGLDRDEIDRAVPEIIQFSELGTAINHPVKTYSSGMGVRLGFACAVYVQPDILIVDEALSVGDAYFQNKCMHKIKSLLDAGTTFLYVTHAADSIRSLCEEGLWLQDGHVMAHGTAGNVGRAYQSMIYKRLSGAGLGRKTTTSMTDAPSPKTEEAARVVHGEGLSADVEPQALRPPQAQELFESRVAPFRTGSGEIRVQDIVLVDEDGNDTDAIDFDRRHLIRVLLQVHAEVDEKTALCVGVTDQSGRQLVHVNSLDHGFDLHRCRVGGQEIVEVAYHSPLCPGEYGIIAGISRMTPNPRHPTQMLNESVIDYCVGGSRFSIRYPSNEEGRDLWGLVAVEAEVEWHSGS